MTTGPPDGRSKNLGARPSMTYEFRAEVTFLHCTFFLEPNVQVSGRNTFGEDSNCHTDGRERSELDARCRIENLIELPSGDSFCGVARAVMTTEDGGQSGDKSPHSKFFAPHSTGEWNDHSTPRRPAEHGSPNGPTNAGPTNAAETRARCACQARANKTRVINASCAMPPHLRCYG